MNLSYDTVTAMRHMANNLRDDHIAPRVDMSYVADLLEQAAQVAAMMVLHGSPGRFMVRLVYVDAYVEETHLVEANNAAHAVAVAVRRTAYSQRTPTNAFVKPVANEGASEEA